MSTELAEVEPTELEAEAGSLLAQARSFAIATDEDAKNAAAFLQECKALKKKVTDTFGPMKKAASDAHKQVVATETANLEPIEKADRLVRDKVGAWTAEQERIRNEELRAAQAKAEAEERARREEEAKRQQEEIAKQREAAAAAKKAGDAERAKELREQAAQQEAVAKEAAAAPVIVVVEAPKAAAKLEGVSSRKDYDFQIIDVRLIPTEYLKVDEVAIRKVVKALKDRCNIPGIKVITKSVVAVR